MRNLKLVLVAILTVVFAFSSCKEDAVTVNDVKLNDVTLSRSTDYGDDWIYYSFVDEKEVTIIDSESSQDWDIAFNRYNVRTNSGESGPGQGGAYDAGAVEWADVVEANESGYTLDGTIQIVESFNSITHAPNYIGSAGSEVFVDCFVLDYSTGAPIYIPNEHVYVMKTAAGKYVKIMIKKFYNEAGDSGFVQFKYSYQNGDGRTFE